MGAPFLLLLHFFFSFFFSPSVSVFWFVHDIQGKGWGAIGGWGWQKVVFRHTTFLCRIRVWMMCRALGCAAFLLFDDDLMLCVLIEVYIDWEEQRW